MNEELKRIGSIFRAKRIDLKLSLKEVENSISIRTLYLQGIEEGTIGELISGVYAVGFLKQYAQFLGIDVQTLMKEYPAAFCMPPSPHPFEFGIGTLEIREHRNNKKSWFYVLIWTLGGTLFFALLWFIVKSL